MDYATAGDEGRTLDEQGDALGALDLLDEGVLLLAERVLVHESGVPEHVGREVVDRVLGRAAADELETLHVAALGAAEGHDALLGEHVEREGVDTLLVDDDERVRLLAVLEVAVLVELGVAHGLLERDDLAHLGVGELALGLDELLALLGGRVEEARVDLRLLVLERDVEREDEAVLEPLGHVRVPSTVVEHEALDEARVDVGQVLHLHHLDHVQVDRLERDRKSVV